MRWPYERPCPFDESTPHLRACWERSTALFAELQSQFVSAGVTEQVRTVYVAGSLGRMEVVESSDCDVVVVLSEQDRQSPTDCMDLVFDCVERAGFQRPKPGGIFGSPTSFEQLLDPSAAGQVDEDLAVFGKRIQALLDSQPLLHFKEFESLQRAILERYATAPVADEGSFSLGWLVDDLIRYWRSLCSRTRWFSHEKPIQWRSVNVKLRHSRMLLCAGLFRLLHAAARDGFEMNSLLSQLRFVPLERVAGQLNTQVGAASFVPDVLRSYDSFMQAMSNDLKTVVADEDRFHSLIRNGAELSQFVGDLMGDEFGEMISRGLFGELA